MPNMSPEIALKYRERVEEFRRKHRTGLVTLLFTDIVGATKLKQSVGDREGVALIQHHHEVVREILSPFTEAGEISTAGDSFFIVFVKPSDAVRFALQLQARLRVMVRAGQGAIQDRIGIHIGEVVIEEREGAPKPRDLYGTQVDICARVMSLAAADQILLTRSAFDNARQVLKGEDIPGLIELCWLNHGPYVVAGVEEALEVCEVGESGRAQLRAPADASKARRMISPGEEPVPGWRPGLGQVVPSTKWELEKKLGEGGFGEVWLGRHQTMKERRVFKFCFRADRVRSLKREMTLFRLIKERIGDHPNIVSLREVFFDEPPFYVVMDFVDGSDLRSWAEAQGGLAKVPLETKLEAVAQVAEALQAAHDAGVIHRDVKPGNILVAGEKRFESPGDQPPDVPLGERPSSLRIKLTDFGIGQVVSQEALVGVTRVGFTQTLVADASSSHTGSQMYMAPELLSGKPASIRSDVYSLGVVLYQILAGDFTRPLTTDWAREVADPLLREDLQHCVAGRPEERFAGAAQLSRHLRSLPQRRADLARRQAELAACEKAAYRRGMLRTTTVAVLILAAISVLAIYALTESRHARAEAQRADLNAQNAVRQRDLAQRSVYDADMVLAFQALDAGNLGHARELMRKHLPRKGEADLRGWEWRCLWQQCRGDDLFTLNEETNGWYSVVQCFPEGRTVAAASMTDRTVKLFDLQSRQIVATLPHSESVGALAVSPDGKLLASGCDDGTIRLWDVAARQVTVQWTNANAQPVSALLFSGDGKVLAWADHEHAVLWDVAARRERASHARHLDTPGFKSGLALSSVNGLFAFGRQDGKIEVWDWQGASRKAVLEGHRSRILTLAFSPDGKSLVSGDQSGVGRVWAMSTAQTVATLTNHAAWIGALSFSPDGKTLATASADQTVKLWSTESWEATTTLRGHEFEVWWVMYSPDGRQLVTASRDGTLKVWDAHVGFRGRVVRLPVSWPHWLSPNGQSLLLGHTNGTFSVLDFSTLREAEQHSWPATAEWAGVAISNDKRRIAKGFPDGSFQLLDASNGHVLASYPTNPKGAAPLRIDFSPDGTIVAVIRGDRDHPADPDRVVELWDLGTGRPTRRVGLRPSQISKVSFSPDTRTLALGYRDGIVELWDFTTREKRALVDPTCAGILGLGYSEDGHVLATAGWGAHIELWDAKTGRELARIGGALGGFASPAFSGDGGRLAAGVDDGTVGLWDMIGSKPQQVAKLKAGEDIPVCVSFPPDGDTLIARDNHAFYIWRAPSFSEIDAVEKARGRPH